MGGQWSILLVISPSATMAKYITESVANYATQIDYHLLSTPLLDFQMFPQLIVPTEFLSPVLRELPTLVHRLFASQLVNLRNGTHFSDFCWRWGPVEAIANIFHRIFLGHTSSLGAHSPLFCMMSTNTWMMEIWLEFLCHVCSIYSKQMTKSPSMLPRIGW